MSPPSLLSVPNVSEGARPGVVAAIGQAITRENGSDEGAARLLDVHFDRDHDRAVFTVAGRQGTIAEAMLRCGREAVERIDVMDGEAGSTHTWGPWTWSPWCTCARRTAGRHARRR